MTKDTIKTSYRVQQPWAVRALERDNYQCVKCGLKEKIIVHHIDGSRRLGTRFMNNNIVNLMTLCKYCHAQVHGYTKVTRDQIPVIRQLLLQGNSYREISRLLRVSCERISQIIEKEPELNIDIFAIKKALSST